MAIEKVDIQKFVELAKEHPVLDARSPGEFAHAHFPGAISLPLFSDEERKVVGTAYNQKSREEAIKIGLEYFGLKMRKMVEEVENLVARLPSTKSDENAMAGTALPFAGDTIWGQDEKNRPCSINDQTTGTSRRSPVVLVHCWRGGMRSTAISWLLDLYGFKVYLLEGGYKKFRNYVLETFKTPFTFKILSGFTGSGKTSILKVLANKGRTVINLEELANHRGSAFGTTGSQPSQEMFENLLAIKLRACSPNHSSLSADYCIWLEDESQRIGSVIIPPDLWEQMCHAPIYFLDIPFNERLENIVNEYGKGSKQDLTDAILRIQKRLGGLEAKNAIRLLRENYTYESFGILLAYYDKCYLRSLLKRHDAVPPLKKIACETVDEKENAMKLLKALGSKERSF